jgi:hypothetical protein
MHQGLALRNSPGRTKKRTASFKVMPMTARPVYPSIDESGRASDVECEYHLPPALRSLARVDESVVVGDAVVVRALVFDRQRLAIR